MTLAHDIRHALRHQTNPPKTALGARLQFSWHPSLFSDETHALLQTLCGPIREDGPVAVSVVFRDEPFRIMGYSVDGSLIRQGDQFVRITRPCSELDPSAMELRRTLQSDSRLPVAIGDCLLELRNEGVELREGQAYLTPNSLTVLNVSGRNLCRPGRTEKLHAAHMLRAPGSAHEDLILRAELDELYRCLVFLSDPTRDNRNTQEEILRRIPDMSELKVPIFSKTRLSKPREMEAELLADLPRVLAAIRQRDS